jgi:hypothetical protein
MLTKTIEEIKKITWINKSVGNKFQSLPKLNLSGLLINDNRQGAISKNA